MQHRLMLSNLSDSLVIRVFNNGIGAWQFWTDTPDNVIGCNPTRVRTYNENKTITLKCECEKKLKMVSVCVCVCVRASARARALQTF